MDNDERKLKLATQVPDPPELTAEVLRQIEDEAREWRVAFSSHTAAMEIIAAEDLKVRAR